MYIIFSLLIFTSRSVPERDRIAWLLRDEEAHTEKNVTEKNVRSNRGNRGNKIREIMEQRDFLYIFLMINMEK